MALMRWMRFEGRHNIKLVCRYQIPTYDINAEESQRKNFLQRIFFTNYVNLIK